jgi:5S rRNA maturation endonuclease (ribonuclease M5)
VETEGLQEDRCGRELRVKGRVDIQKLLLKLGLDATLKGDEWQTKCPSGIHPDEHPSWSIKDAPGNPKHGTHYCFSCHYAGNPIGLVMKVIGISFSSARAWVEENAIIEVIPKPLVVRMKPLTKARFQLIHPVSFTDLDQWVQPAREYATKRGITQEQVKKWGLGYAVNGRLAGRIVFPVYNADRHMDSYAARTYVDSPKRYLMPDEGLSKVTNKPKENPNLETIWGEAHWPPIEERRTLIITEGAINGLACERVSDIPISALMGSHIRLTHLSKITTFKEWILLTDPDYAGDTAVKELAASLLRYGKVYRPKFDPKTDAQSIPPEKLRWLIESRNSAVL